MTYVVGSGLMNPAMLSGGDVGNSGIGVGVIGVTVGIAKLTNVGKADGAT